MILVPITKIKIKRLWKFLNKVNNELYKVTKMYLFIF